MAASGRVVQVTAEDIEGGKQNSSSHCMIAEAIKRAYPDAKSVSVDLQTIRFSDPKKRKRFVYLTPPRAQRELLAFDDGVDVEPFAIRLPRPAQVLEIANRQPKAVKATKDSSRSQFTVTGGKEPPAGPLSGGAKRPGPKAERRGKQIGRIRAFGLRSMGRSETVA